MGTSLAWSTDTHLHDAVRLQLDEDSGKSEPRTSRSSLQTVSLP
jgi:hypothetical protein